MKASQSRAAPYWAVTAGPEQPFARADARARQDDSRADQPDPELPAGPRRLGKIADFPSRQEFPAPGFEHLSPVGLSRFRRHRAGSVGKTSLGNRLARGEQRSRSFIDESEIASDRRLRETRAFLDVRPRLKSAASQFCVAQTKDLPGGPRTGDRHDPDPIGRWSAVKGKYGRKDRRCKTADLQPGTPPDSRVAVPVIQTDACLRLRPVRGVRPSLPSRPRMLRRLHTCHTCHSRRACLILASISASDDVRRNNVRDPQMWPDRCARMRARNMSSSSSHNPNARTKRNAPCIRCSSNIHSSFPSRFFIE